MHIYIWQRLQVVHPGQDILQIAMSPTPVIGVLKCLSVTGAPTNIWRKHHVSLLRKELREWEVGVGILPSRTAMDPQNPWKPLTRRNVRWSVEIRGNSEAACALVCDFFWASYFRLVCRNRMRQLPDATAVE